MDGVCPYTTAAQQSVVPVCKATLAGWCMLSSTLAGWRLSDGALSKVTVRLQPSNGGGVGMGFLTWVDGARFGLNCLAHHD